MAKSRFGLALIISALLSLVVPAAATPAIATVQVTVLATGSAALTYQWYKSGVAVAGQTSASITIPASDVSLYSIVVTDADGSTQGATVHVTVNAPVVVVPPPPPPVTTVGPRSPVGPQAASVTCVGTQLAAGANLQSAVNSAPAGTTFCLAAGIYRNQHVTPKTGNKFIGKIGTILDGQNTTRNAFVGTTGNAGVTIQNLVIQNYSGGYQVPAIATGSGSGWHILNNEIRTNDGVGVYVSTNTLLQYNYIHHNKEMGYGTGNGSTGIRILDNEIASNNYGDAYDCGNECGGGKLWATVGAVISNNYSHDNHGPGFWDDFNNQNITYAFNRIEGNFGPGIFHEIGYNASINDNVLIGNGAPATPNLNPPCVWLWCSAIQIAASGGVSGGLVDIYNNQITTSANGQAVGLIQQNRASSGTPSMGPWLVQNVSVHDNTVDLSRGGHMGGVQDMGSNAMFVAGVNKFDRNHYILGSNAAAFWWAGGSGGKAFWQGQGMDLAGTFQ